MTRITFPDHKELEARRLRAAELFAAGVSQAEVARQLGVTRQSAHRWHARWKAGGTQALTSRGPTGYATRLTGQDLQRLTELLLAGASAHGFTGDLWTVSRITQLIAREFGGHVVSALNVQVGLRDQVSAWVLTGEHLGTLGEVFASGCVPTSAPSWVRWTVRPTTSICSSSTRCRSRSPGWRTP